MSVPVISITLALEGTPRVEIVADSYENEQRVRVYGSRLSVRRRVLVELDRILEALSVVEVEGEA